MFEDYASNSEPAPVANHIVDDMNAVEVMLRNPKDLLKSMFNHIEIMPLWPEAKRMALANVMMSLITIIHGEVIQ